MTALIRPAVQTVDVGGEAVLQCVGGGHPTGRARWLHDGRAVAAGPRLIIDPPDRLVIRSLTKPDRGMYQCVIANEWEQVQATAELRLGGTCIVKLKLFLNDTFCAIVTQS